MRPARLWAAWLLLIGLAWPGVAGELVTINFTGGQEPVPEVLAHVELKAVISELLDAQDTGLGASVGALLWRETLTAISDQAGAGVILARSEERLVDLLERQYHRAATRIALDQKARMVLWGAVEEASGTVFVNTYLTLLTASGKSDISIQLLGTRTDSDERIGLEATVPRTRFNFSVVPTTVDELFGRPVIVRSATAIRTRPDRQAETLRSVPAGTLLDAVGMDGDWFEVRLEEGEGYVWSGRVDLPPRAIEAARLAATLYTGPGRDSATAGPVALDGRYEVLDMRYRQGHGLWYRIRAGESVGWIEAFRVRARYSFPAVHFLAGLYRHYAGRHEDAAREFQQFIDAPYPTPSRVNLAAAHQLLGASRFLVGRTREAAYDSFSRAIELTPYDPSAYLLRSLAALAVRESAEQALQDLDAAVALDRRDERTRDFARQILDLGRRPSETAEAIRRRTGVHRIADQTERLLEPRPAGPSPR